MQQKKLKPLKALQKKRKMEGKHTKHIQNQIVKQGKYIQVVQVELNLQ